MTDPSRNFRRSYTQAWLHRISSSDGGRSHSRSLCGWQIATTVSKVMLGGGSRAYPLPLFGVHLDAGASHFGGGRVLEVIGIFHSVQLGVACRMGIHMVMRTVEAACIVVLMVAVSIVGHIVGLSPGPVRLVALHGRKCARLEVLQVQTCARLEVVSVAYGHGVRVQARRSSHGATGRVVGRRVFS